MKKDNDLKVIEETSKIINDIEKGFYEILANNTMRICTTYEQELTKYKRAFEIFTKDKELTLHKGKCPILDIDEYKLAFVNWKSLTKEEYELLEELMKDVKD